MSFAANCGVEVLGDGVLVQKRLVWVKRLIYLVITNLNFYIKQQDRPQ